MKKVLAQGAKYIFAVFAIAVFGLLMSLTYQALQRIFPNRFDNQIWGLILFDIAAICWAITYIFHSKSTQQYAVAGIGFIAGLLGTLGMIAAEVTLSGNLVEVNAQQIGQWLVWGFIGATALHVILVYMHHFGAPELIEQINVGIARGEIVTEAIRQATEGLEHEKAILAESIARDITDQVKRDLNLPILADPRMPIIPHPNTYEQTASQLTEEEKAKYKALGMWNPNDPNDTPFERSRPEVHRALTQQNKDEATKPEAPFRGSPSE